MNAVDWTLLERQAREVQKNAHAPYSGYRVGAAVQSDDGRVFIGCNVENASYGLCLCAERSAIGAAIAAGALRFVAMVIVTQGKRPGTPCGMCRQVMSEFPPSFSIRCAGDEGGLLETDVAELLPFAFTREHLDE